MLFSGSTSRLRITIAAAIAIGFATGATAMAGAKPKSTELSPSALGMETKSHGYERGREKAKKPGEFDLGGRTLHSAADKKDPIPPVGFETNSQPVLNKAPT